MNRRHSTTKAHARRSRARDAYFHAPGADTTPTADYELFETVVLAKDRQCGERED